VNFNGEKRTNQTHQLKSGPDGQLAHKGAGKEAKLSYTGNLLVENRNGLIMSMALPPLRPRFCATCGVMHMFRHSRTNSWCQNLYRRPRSPAQSPESAVAMAIAAKRSAVPVASHTRLDVTERCDMWVIGSARRKGSASKNALAG
jgi:hypothetical protein